MAGILIIIFGTADKIQKLVNVFGIEDLVRVVQLSFRQEACQTAIHIRRGLQVDIKWDYQSATRSDWGDESETNLFGLRFAALVQGCFVGCSCVFGKPMSNTP
jgi:hypothetical protein